MSAPFRTFVRRTCRYMLAFLLLPVLAVAETAVDVSYSHRIVPIGTVQDPEVMEGGIEAIFTGTGPIDLVSPATGFTRIDAYSFSYTFAWDDLGPLDVRFTDAAGDTTTVSAVPIPPQPLDPTLHTMPVIHIRTDPANLWDPAIGIYVWGDSENFYQSGEEWERPATFTYYDDSAVPEFTGEIGLRIHGGWSRNYDQKGLRFYFDHAGPPYHFEYDVFQSDPADFERLLFRTNRYPERAIASDLMETVFRDQGHIGSRGRKVVSYLNDEYWGIYSLRERLDESFVEYTLGHEGDYILIKDCESEHGDESVWLDFLSDLDVIGDPTSHDWYVWMNGNLDMGSYIDWVLFNAFGASADNVHCRNLVLLQLDGGPWRYIMWDEDALFLYGNEESNHLMWYSATTETDYDTYRPPVMYSGSWQSCQLYFRIFARLLENSEFKARFFARAEELLAGDLSADALCDRIEEMDAIYQPENTMHADRWDLIHGYYPYVSQWCRTWITDRHPVFAAQLDDFREYHRVPVELSRFETRAGASGITLTWRTESEEDNAGFLLHRRIGVSGTWEIVASHGEHAELVGAGTTSEPTEYAFTDTPPKVNEVLHYRLSHVSASGDTTEVDWTESVSPYYLDDIEINEIQADNESTIIDDHLEYDDWFEIANTGEQAVLLDSLYVSDDEDLLTQHRLDGGLTIPAGGYLVLWADGQPEQGSAHLPFRLSGSGETLFLVASDGVTVLDEVEFPEQIEDHVYQRDPDTPSLWSHAWTPTPGAANEPPHLERFLVLNEIMTDNESTVLDEAHDWDPWLEIRNPLPQALDLTGNSLTDDPTVPGKWVMPSHEIPAEGYVLVWLDGEPCDGPLHTGFVVDTDTDRLCLFGPDETEIQDVILPFLVADRVYARIPDDGELQVTPLATPGAANPTSLDPPVVINEFLASNDATNTDEAGEYDDWVELYNPTDEPFDLGGCFLSDDPDESDKWEFPEVTLLPGEHLLVWCDDDEEQGPLHTSFKLSAGGESVYLFESATDGNAVIDGHDFGAQATDVSEGRLGDGGHAWIRFLAPTPGTVNDSDTAADDMPTAHLGFTRCHPNPFNPAITLEFSLPATREIDLAVFDLRGRRVQTLKRGVETSGTHTATWSGTDAGGAHVPSGIYFARLVSGDFTETRKLTLLK